MNPERDSRRPSLEERTSQQPPDHSDSLRQQEPEDWLRLSFRWISDEVKAIPGTLVDSVKLGFSPLPRHGLSLKETWEGFKDGLCRRFPIFSLIVVGTESLISGVSGLGSIEALARGSVKESAALGVLSLGTGAVSYGTWKLAQFCIGRVQRHSAES